MLDLLFRRDSFLTVALIRADDSDISWFSCRVPPAKQLSLRLTAAAFAVGIPHESSVAEAVLIAVFRPCYTS